MSGKRLTVLHSGDVPLPTDDEVPAPKSDDNHLEPKESRQPGGRRLSLSKQAPTFKDRRIKFGGDTAVDVDGGGMDELRMRGIGHVCRRGKKADSPCQDDFFVVAEPTWVLAGVFDGHGPVGHLLANTAQHTVMDHLLSDEGELMANTSSVLAASFEKAHAACEKMAGSHTAGTTATATLITPETVTAAWCGDSRAILGKKLDEDGTKWEIKALTFEHRPSDKKERKRIEEAGGKVEVYEGGEGAESRLFDAGMEGPGLAMSRAIGDLWGHECGMIHVPDVNTEKTAGYDFFCCGSDGVWDFMSNEEVAGIVHEFGRAGAALACDKIMKLAWSRWEEEGDVVDDISFVIVWLPLEEKFGAPSI